jgi:hypothetical protein
LYLNLTGDAIADAYSVHRIRVKVAQDELGRDLKKLAEVPSGVLLKPGSAAPLAIDEQRRLEAVAAEVARRRMLRETTTGGVSAEAPMPVTSRGPRPVITLRNPSRHSTTIKLVEGEIDLFTPTEANGALVRLPEIAAHPGDPVKNAALEALEIQVVYFNRETFEAKGNLLGSGAKERYAAAFKQIGAKTVGIFLRDPKRLVVDFELQKNDGKPIRMNSYSTGSNEWGRAMFAASPPPVDAQLVVRIATPGAIKSYPFKLEDVPLP